MRAQVVMFDVLACDILCITAYVPIAGSSWVMERETPGPGVLAAPWVGQKGDDVLLFGSREVREEPEYREGKAEQREPMHSQTSAGMGWILQGSRGTVHDKSLPRKGPVLQGCSEHRGICLPPPFGILGAFDVRKRPNRTLFKSLAELSSCQGQ